MTPICNLQQVLSGRPDVKLQVAAAGCPQATADDDSAEAQGCLQLRSVHPQQQAECLGLLLAPPKECAAQVAATHQLVDRSD